MNPRVGNAGGGQTRFLASSQPWVGLSGAADARAIEPLPVLFPEETGIGPSLFQDSVELGAHFLVPREFLVSYRQPVSPLGIGVPPLEKKPEKLLRLLELAVLKVGFSNVPENVSQVKVGFQPVGFLVLFQGARPISFRLENPSQVIVVIRIPRIDLQGAFEVSPGRIKVVSLEMNQAQLVMGVRIPWVKGQALESLLKIARTPTLGQTEIPESAEMKDREWNQNQERKRKQENREN